ncbi:MULTISPECIES: hypothetical protein [unclassified Bradyrhizobium]|uniref:hypothetical protein n=1 Tax=unclassified Bradyrhizobium TaxID=2631580 RepID=UPI003395F445
MTETNLTDLDREALTRAIAVARRESPTRRKQIDDRLAREPWEVAARYAAFCAQITSMNLEPWESTLVYPDTPEAHALVRRLKAAGVSQYEPNPLEALAEAEHRAT